jgi:hypothetical protein
MVELLLRSWAPADVADQIDYETLRAESPKNYDNNRRLRTGDHVWTVRLKAGGLVWIAILMEFQASGDRTVPWRVLSYATTFWRRIESTGRLQDGKLPGVLQRPAGPVRVRQSARGLATLDAYPSARLFAGRCPAGGRGPP